MSWILSIYSTKAFKEVLLPAINNADFTVTLSKSIFALSKDVDIKMEIVENTWYISKSQLFTMRYTHTKEMYEGSAIVNGDFLTINTYDGNIINVMVKEVNDSFRVYKKYILTGEKLVIGKNDNSDIKYDTLNLISREHGILKRNGAHYIIEDKSSNGIFINNKRLVGSWQLEFGDCIDIFGLRIIYLGNIIAINEGIEGLILNKGGLQEYQNVAEKPVKDTNSDTGVFVFHRSPRKIFKIDSDAIEIEAPPAAKEKNKQPIGMLIGPSLTMALPMLLGCSLSIYGTQMTGGRSGIYMYTGLVTAITSAIIGVVWSLVNLNYNKKKSREEELHRFEVYSEYLINCANNVKDKYEKNTQALIEMYKSAEKCCEYSKSVPALWNRNISHSDFLYCRMGIGDIPFQVKIEIPKEKFTMINDSLAEKPKLIKESYNMLHDVPIGVDLLQHRLVGVFGGEKKKGAIDATYNIVAQLAANNCYTDLKMVFIYDESNYEDSNTWAFAKWLPHVWSEDKKTRFVAQNKSEASDVLYELTKVLRIRAEESADTRKSDKLPKPYYVLFIADPALLEGELISKYIFDNKDEYGLTTILIEDKYNKLPNACEYLIQNDKEFTGIYSITDNDDEKTKVKFDIISEVSLENLGRRLSNVIVNEVEVGGEIPNALTFFEMYNVNRLEELNVLDRWRKNRTYESMKALIGQKSGGVDCYLDVHEKYHGPHGLVAGTTGSGKSETLQTYMLSLALNFSPDDIGFFVIDYKGGGMANLFSGLPHMIGQISNLSGNQVHRAMVSIKSENMRRQRVFNEHGVNNINLYTKLYKNNEAAEPIPHMFIVIDEFAELKREEPDFMRELISVAQVGRSLGVHLILATQKPSGTVDDNIWSNSKFKLCLRVQDRQDSTDMLHKPDAAYITQAGRCYLQVGNDELYELFQSGYSGATYDESEDAVKTDIAKMISNTGKAALVGSRIKLKHREKAKEEWISKLVEVANDTYQRLNMPVEQGYTHETHDAVINEFFNNIDRANVEYQKSEYNIHRVEDFLSLFAQTQEAREIIALASKNNKKLPEMKEKTQLDAVVEYLAKIADSNGYTHNLQLWLPVLPTELYIDELDGYSTCTYKNGTWPQSSDKWELNVHIGLCDDPVNQAQMPLFVDLANNGHHAICGTVVSGKSTFLQTLVYALINKYTPKDINIYAIDFGSKMLSAFDKAPHVGGVIYETDDEKLDKFITMLGSILAKRKELFTGGNYSQYVQAHGVEIPAIIIVIDNYAGFRNKTNCKYDDFIMQLSKDGVGYGIFMIITAAGFGTNEIPNRMGDNIRTVMTLEMTDKFAYADALKTMRIDVMPEENVKGRGLVKLGESVLEYQTALALKAENDFKRSEEISQLCEDMRANWKGRCAKAIPEIPDDFTLDKFWDNDDIDALIEDDRHLPVGYEQKTVEIFSIDLSKNYCYLILGKPRSGKTNALKVILESALRKGGRIVLFDFNDEYKSFCQNKDITYITDDKTMFDYFGTDLGNKFKSRNVVKRQYVSDGLSDEEIYNNMKTEEPIYHFIGNLYEFMQHVYKPSDGIGNISGFIETLMDKGSLHNVFWFGALSTDNTSDMAVYTAYKYFTKNKMGMHFGGNVANQRVFNFDSLPYSEQSKPEKAGIAMIPAVEDGDIVQRIVLPQIKSQTRQK